MFLIFAPGARRYCFENVIAGLKFVVDVVCVTVERNQGIKVTSRILVFLFVETGVLSFMISSAKFTSLVRHVEMVAENLTAEVLPCSCFLFGDRR